MRPLTGSGHLCQAQGRQGRWGLDIRESWAEYDGTGSRTLEVHVLNGVMEAVVTDGKVTRRPLVYHRQVTEPEGSHDPTWAPLASQSFS